MNFWFAYRRAKIRLQEVEIAPFVGLLDVFGEHPAVAALVVCLGLLPRGAPFVSSASGTSRLIVRAATSKVIWSPLRTSAKGPPT